MSRPLEKFKAIELRLKGMSYSEIKSRLNISKSTLSNWLAPYPLSSQRIKELRDFNPQRIEKSRNTKAKKRANRLNAVYKRVSADIRKLTKRELFIAGTFLYWGEGSKSERTTTGLSNTDPAVLVFFLKWLELFSVDFRKISATLHLYRDMDEKKEINFWKSKLKLPVGAFRKSYIKQSTLKGLTYKGGFGHGTCNIRVYNRDLTEYVHSAIKYVSSCEFNDRM